MTPPEYWAFRRTAAHREFLAARDFLLAHADRHDAAVAGFQWPRPTYFNWALEWFDVIAHRNSREALVFFRGGQPEQALSFQELSANSDRTAAWLAELGVHRHDRVLLFLESRPELWEITLACIKLGAVIVPSYTSLTTTEITDRVNRADIAHVVSTADGTELFPRVRGQRIAVGAAVPGWIPFEDRVRGGLRRFVPSRPTPADDIAFCYFTSGTTSAPKLVAHTHASYPIGHLSSMFWSGLRPGDRHLNVSQPGWAKHAWSSFFVPWNAEATIVVDRLASTAPRSLPDTLVVAEVNSICAPPSTWHVLARHLDRARPRLREATSAGEPLPAEQAERVYRHWGVRIRDGYGQSEATAIIGTSPGLRPSPGRLGKPLPGYAVTLRDEQGAINGTHGELCVELDPRPVGLTAGYLNAGTTVDPAADGYYRTGDMATRDPDGWFRIIGRKDDVFKSFDVRISPLEGEAILREHPSVMDCVIVPRPHPVGGATSHAIVIPEPAHDTRLAEELSRYCGRRMAPEVAPRSFSFADAFPRTASGKVRRSKLAMELVSGPDHDATSA